MKYGIRCLTGLALASLVAGCGTASDTVGGGGQAGSSDTTSGGAGGSAGTSQGGSAGSAAGGRGGATGGSGAAGAHGGAGGGVGGSAGAASGGAGGGGTAGGGAGNSGAAGSPVVGGTAHIVVIGDSISQGSKGQDGYVAPQGVPPEVSFRYDLWKKLVDANANFQFVGSLTKGFLGDNPAWSVDYMNKSFQPNHEAVWGISAKDQIAGDPSSTDPGGNGPLPPLATRLQGYDVDIAIIQLGGNDYQDPVTHLKQSAADKANDIGTIIDLVRAKNPKVICLVIKAHNASTVFFDDQGQVVDAKNTAESPVVTVDLTIGFDSQQGADTFDGAHTNPSGDQKWADGLFAALKNYLP